MSNEFILDSKLIKAKLNIVLSLTYSFRNKLNHLQLIIEECDDILKKMNNSELEKNGLEAELKDYQKLVEEELKKIKNKCTKMAEQYFKIILEHKCEVKMHPNREPPKEVKN